MGRKRAILLIDQDQDTCRTAATVLNEAGFEVDLASDGPSGLQKLEAGHHRGVLIDAGLAGLDTDNLGSRIADLATLPVPGLASPALNRPAAPTPRIAAACR